MKCLGRLLLTASCSLLLTRATAGETGKQTTPNVFAEAYVKMSLEQLATHMSNEVPTRRLYVAQAIATAARRVGLACHRYGVSSLCGKTNFDEGHCEGCVTNHREMFYRR